MTYPSIALPDSKSSGKDDRHVGEIDLRERDGHEDPDDGCATEHVGTA